ncbi:acyltransferase family protein [Aureitalea marina]|uniref:Acyltransferase 3 domain-containing protein n=1 Tax=Aureitalea marina TaxID=930804 RepID=A0A2S7KR64_9FLAO|nr:acyltransferase [Aureitalea marina]PQB05078.1 hypothetical protein BST85_09350 [Aureitalea marina]
MNLRKQLSSLRLQRVSNHRYIAELDGLRFIAIISVVLFHSNGRLREYFQIEYPFVSDFLRSGFFGVEIFFAISGYILSLHILKSESFRYGDYLKRRVLRIEPPFIIAMLLQYCLLMITKPGIREDMTRSLLHVLTYTSNFIGENLINGITWSLEIEVQFYLILPLILLLRYLKTPVFIISLLVLGLLSMNLNNYIEFKFITKFFNYFLVGIFIAILQTRKIKIRTHFPGFNIILVFGIFLLSMKGLQDWIPTHVINIVRLLFMLILFNNVLILKSGIRFFKIRFVALFGGMCYTIYLYHIIVLSAFSRLILPQIRDLIASDSLFYWLGLSLMVIFSLFLSVIPYVLFERPFMYRDWPKRMLVLLGLGKKSD